MKHFSWFTTVGGLLLVMARWSSTAKIPPPNSASRLPTANEVFAQELDFSKLNLDINQFIQPILNIFPRKNESNFESTNEQQQQQQEQQEQKQRGRRSGQQRQPQSDRRASNADGPANTPKKTPMSPEDQERINKGIGRLISNIFNFGKAERRQTPAVGGQTTNVDIGRRQQRWNRRNNKKIIEHRKPSFVDAEDELHNHSFDTDDENQESQQTILAARPGGFDDAQAEESGEFFTLEEAFPDQVFPSSGASFPSTNAVKKGSKIPANRRRKANRISQDAPAPPNNTNKRRKRRGKGQQMIQNRRTPSKPNQTIRSWPGVQGSSGRRGRKAVATSKRRQAQLSTRLQTANARGRRNMLLGGSMSQQSRIQRDDSIRQNDVADLSRPRISPIRSSRLPNKQRDPYTAYERTAGSSAGIINIIDDASVEGGGGSGLRTGPSYQIEPSSPGRKIIRQMVDEHRRRNLLRRRRRGRF